MKNTDQKSEFIRLRAEGKSYRAIEAETGISRSTCSEWARELSAEVERLRREHLEELYSAYGMAREARIRRLGETLKRIDEALAAVDLSQLPPDKLLGLKLKYIEALGREYSAAAPLEATGAADDTLEAIRDLYRRTASGETSIDQAKTELSILGQMAKDYTRANPMDMFIK